MIEIIAFFLAVSFVLYTIFGGADFGAGILELTCPARSKRAFREVVTKAISPVWEANHIWIILCIVIIFTAYPTAYSQISTTFHLPLLLMLFGIVLRGCAFVFRHYDTDEGMVKELHSGIFAVASVFTPFAQGLIAGGLILGESSPKVQNFKTLYIDPWLSYFSFATGVFFTAMCALTAAVFLLCESEAAEFRRMLRRRVHLTSLLTLGAGTAVFMLSKVGDSSLFELFFARKFCTATFILALVSLAVLNYLSHDAAHKQKLRALICVFITLILCGWWTLQFPYLIGIPELGNHSFSLYESASSERVLEQLVIALLAGSFLIFPALFYLIHVFKYQKSPRA